MPVVEAPLYTYLSAELSVGNRVYPKRAPEGAVLPYVIFDRVSSRRTMTHDAFGVMKAWVRARVSFTARDITMLGAITIGEELVAALSGYGDHNPIGSCEVATEIDLYDAQTKLYSRVTDVFVSYEDA